MIMMRCVQKLQTATDTALMYCDMLRERIPNYILPLGVVETSSVSRRHDRSIELNSLEFATISCFLSPISSHLHRIQRTQGIWRSFFRSSIFAAHVIGQISFLLAHNAVWNNVNVVCVHNGVNKRRNRSNWHTHIQCRGMTAGRMIKTTTSNIQLWMEWYVRTNQHRYVH